MSKKTKLGKLADNIEQLGKKTLPKYVQDAMLDDARYVGEEMLSGYNHYVNTHTNIDTDGEFTHISGKDTPYKASVYIIKDGTTGVRVGLRGDNVTYYEFGTGNIGRNTYPDNIKLNKIGWVYGSGTKILQNGKWKNAHFNDIVPKWYKTLLKQGRVSKSDTVWVYNGTIRRGLPAGAFIYDAIEAFESSLDSDDAYSTKMNYKLSRKNIYQYVSAELNKK